MRREFLFGIGLGAALGALFARGRPAAGMLLGALLAGSARGALRRHRRE